MREVAECRASKPSGATPQARTTIAGASRRVQDRAMPPAALVVVLAGVVGELDVDDLSERVDPRVGPTRADERGRRLKAQHRRE